VVPALQVAAAAELALPDIQGNVVRGYPFHEVAHYFGRIDESCVAAWRALLLTLADGVTTARLWDPEHKPSGAMNVAISYDGLRALGADADGAIARAFPSFAAGMEARSEDLGDDPEKASYREWTERHVWIAVYGSDAGALDGRSAELQGLARRAGLTLSAPLRGSVILDPESGARLEPFGFRDGIANPVVRGDPMLERYELPGNGKYDVNSRGWLPIAPGEFLLGHANEQRQDTLSGELAPHAALLKNGTFAVLRDLRQHVQAFKDYLQECAKKYGRPADFFASKLLGRTLDGDPLAAPGTGNDFTYEGDGAGSGCPLGSHVRRANPRVTGERRLIRRGVPYSRPDGKQGLYFVAYNASIEEQFEFVQKIWINGRAGALSGSTDPVGSSALGNMVIEGDTMVQRPPILLCSMPSFVTCLGGEYYFVPGLEGLRRLARGAP
jgi:Dyp-type peroxidase family